MGTVFSFAVVARPGAEAEEVAAAVGAACRVLHEIDDRFSLWKPDSPMSRVRRGELSAEDMGPDMVDVTALCARARDLSGGYFDPWAVHGGFDPTGLVKGWAIERASQVLLHSGATTAAMVNGGGDIACFGSPAPRRPWRVGLDDPFDPSRIVFVVTGWPAVATSGTYRRGEHLVDPKAGSAAGREPRPPTLAATVVGPELWLADALATAAAVAGAEQALRMIEAIDGYEVLVTSADGERRSSRGLGAVPA